MNELEKRLMERAKKLAQLSWQYLELPFVPNKSWFSPYFLGPQIAVDKAEDETVYMIHDVTYNRVHDTTLLVSFEEAVKTLAQLIWYWAYRYHLDNRLLVSDAIVSVEHAIEEVREWALHAIQKHCKKYEELFTVDGKQK